LFYYKRNKGKVGDHLQPGEAVNSQEQMVNIKNFKMLHFENLELFINLKSKTFFKDNYKNKQNVQNR